MMVLGAPNILHSITVRCIQLKGSGIQTNGSQSTLISRPLAIGLLDLSQHSFTTQHEELRSVPVEEDTQTVDLTLLPALLLSLSTLKHHITDGRFQIEDDEAATASAIEEAGRVRTKNEGVVDYEDRQQQGGHWRRAGNARTD